MTVARFKRIDVVVNNACQTIRRPRAYYSHLIEDEKRVARACLLAQQRAGEVSEEECFSPRVILAGRVRARRRRRGCCCCCVCLRVN